MKTKLLFLTLALFSLSFVACDDDDDNDVRPSQVPQTCLDAFQSMYPNVKNPEWERVGQYYTAEWKEGNGLRDVEAWFRTTPDASGSWAMTQTDYGKDLFLVPTELNVAFNKTEYSTAVIDDIDLYEYPDSTRDIYVIEVTPRGERQDVLLVFRASDCTYLKAVPDNDIDITPDTVL
ncbi:MAG: hypothetical protein NC338_02060 [Firmicutes bacterium]|nr:hypothetical protein [Bacillota bacterium]MCM1400656.1 hypothetical protein [Bacteroides sp.]MCM1476347.1 hypothetical protein [Bacteroides sp.]